MKNQHKELQQSVTRISTPVALTGLMLLASGAALYVAADVLIPVFFAILLNLLLSPVVQGLAKRNIPPSVSAAALVGGLVGATVLIVAVLAEPAENWLNDAPRSIRGLQEQVFMAKDRIENIEVLANEVNELTRSDSPKEAQEVVVKGPNVFENLVGGLPEVVAFAGIVIFLTFFLLASGDTFLRRLTRCGRSWSQRRRIVAIARQIQSDLSRYLLTVSAINLLLGLAVAGTMHALGVPNPFLWGAMVSIFNFAPYIGALASTCILTIVGLTTFDTLSQALMVPLAFLALTIFEGQLVTPVIIGRRMALSPIFVFLSVVAWGWMWGIAGALMAVPIVTSLKVVCDHVPGLEPFGAFVRNEKRFSLPAKRIDRVQDPNDRSTIPANGANSGGT